MTERSIPSSQTQDIATGRNETGTPSNRRASDVEQSVTFKHEDLEQRRFSESSTPATADKKPDLTASRKKSSSKEGYQFKNRLSKACDSCSIRKVKCDEQGPPCKACRSLEIPCTFQKPSKRRGPPNKHAESIKKQKLDRTGSDSKAPSPSSPFNQFSPPPASPAAQTSGAESICPFELILLLVDDYYDLCYPITPFPHEPSFKISLKERRDLDDRSFLALLAGMVGFLVAWYPRRAHKRLLSFGLCKVFTRSIDFVTRCREVLLRARGMDYLSSPTLNIYDAATSYFMMSMICCTYQMRGGDLLLGESYNVLRYLEAYKPNNYKRRNRNLDKPVDYIEQQMARRIYWTIFVCVRSASTFAKGASDGEEVMGPETPTRPHPPLPMEIDDEFIDHDIIHPSSKPHARITGFNKNAQIFFILDRLIATELSYGIERAYERERQKKTIVECLNDLDRVYAALPDSLAHGGDQRSTHTQDFEFGTGLKSPKSTEIDDSPFDDTGPRQTTDCETHKANIHSSYLTVRSSLVEKYWTICDAAVQPSRTSSETSFPQQTENPLYESETNFAHIASAEGIRAERRRIATALLQVLSSSKPVFLELNSFPLCMKIRQIASTVTDFEVPENELTNEFLKILSGLEKGGALGRDDDERRSPAIWDSHTEREENELRKWADLSQNQMQYVTMDALPGPQKGKATGSEGL